MADEHSRQGMLAEQALRAELQTAGEFVAREAKRKEAAKAGAAACVTAAARVAVGSAAGGAGHGLEENLRALFPTLAHQTAGSTDVGPVARQNLPLEAAELRRVAAAAAAPASPVKTGISAVQGRGVVEVVEEDGLGTDAAGGEAEESRLLSSVDSPAAARS